MKDWRESVRFNMTTTIPKGPDLVAMMVEAMKRVDEVQDAAIRKRAVERMRQDVNRLLVRNGLPPLRS